MAAPDGLGARGSALWSDLHADGRLWDAVGEVLVVEACRVADRLDALDALVRDDVDGALPEARQQQNVLRQIVVSLGLGKAGEAGSRRSDLDELARRSAARRSAQVPKRSPAG